MNEGTNGIHAPSLPSLLATVDGWTSVPDYFFHLSCPPLPSSPYSAPLRPRNVLSPFVFVGRCTIPAALVLRQESAGFTQFFIKFLLAVGRGTWQNSAAYNCFLTIQKYKSSNRDLRGEISSGRSTPRGQWVSSAMRRAHAGSHYQRSRRGTAKCGSVWALHRPGTATEV